MKITNLFILPLLLLVFSGCKVSKNIAAPKQVLPAGYRDVVATDSANIAQVPWNQFFGNKELQQLIDSALANNFDMQIAMKNIEASQLLVKQSKLGYLPEARLQASGSINRPSDNSLTGLSLSQFLGRPYVEDYAVNVGISWEADIWGKIRNQQSKTLAAFLQTAEARKTIQTGLVSSVAKGYYRLLMLDAQVLIAKKNLALSDSTLQMMELQYRAGQLTALGLQQATAQRLSAAELIPALQRDIELEENRLSILSGVTSRAIRRTGSIYEKIYAGDLSAGYPSALLANRPDIKAKELDLVIANANTGIAKAALYPSLSITASGGVNAFLASNWFSIPASLFTTAFAGITQPLFQQGKLKTQYKVSEVEREKTVIAFRQSVVNAAGEVTEALVKLNRLKEQQAITREKVGTLEQSIGKAKMLFTNGMANYLEVITAQANVLQAELSLAQLQEQQSSAAIELYRSLGGGWK